MLCRYRSSSGCFAAVVVGLHSGRCFAVECVMVIPSADALLQWMFWRIFGRRGLRWRMLCRRCCFGWIGCHRGIVLFIGNHCSVVSFFTGPVCRFWVLRTVASSFLLFSCSYKLYPRSLTTTFVVYNLCYEGSLVSVSYNSLLLNDKQAIFPDREKRLGPCPSVKCQ